MNPFIRSDLSTYNTDDSKKFYTQVLWWNYVDGPYSIAYAWEKEVAGIFETPGFLQEMNMPSFWMSYILVDDVQTTVQIAKKHGAIVEVEPQMDEERMIALIRDPSGAWFTICEDPSQRDMFHRESKPWCIAWNELITGDMQNIQPFYENVFGWEIREESDFRYEIVAQGEVIASIQEMTEEERGGKSRWSVFFAVNDMQQTHQRVEKAWGKRLWARQTDRGLVWRAEGSQWASVMFVQV